MNFQSIVMIVATVILIFALATIGVALSNLNSDIKYPPVIADCPDYWSISKKAIDSNNPNGPTEFTCNKIRNWDTQINLIVLHLIVRVLDIRVLVDYAQKKNGPIIVILRGTE